MINFDYVLFDHTFEEYFQRKILICLHEYFMPLMNEFGILWQTEQFPFHEHFITNLIKQKIHIQTESFNENTSQKQYLLCFVFTRK